MLPRDMDPDPFDPWDRRAADALAGVYRSSGYASGETSSRDDGSDAASNSNIDEAWLESRFAEIARGWFSWRWLFEEDLVDRLVSEGRLERIEPGLVTAPAPG